MKKTAAILSASLLAIIFISEFSSCEKYILPELSFAPDTLTFSAAADSLPIEVTSNVFWEVKHESENSWLSCDPGPYEGNRTIMFEAKANETGNERSISIDIQSESIRKRLYIQQMADTKQ